MANLWFLLLLHLTGVSATTSQLCPGDIPWDYNGTIESPGFPHQYYGNQKCYYYFNMANTFSIWRINFTYFNLPNTCDTDFIEIYFRSLPQKYCQTSTPPDMTGVFYLHFVSSLNSSAGFGFQAKRILLLECGDADIRLQENAPYLFRFRQEHPIQGRCEWAITTDDGLGIMMIGYLEGSESRNQQFRMYKGTTKDESSLITVKSRYNMITFVEASNSILLEYIANYSSIFEISVNFMASQNSTCGSVTNASAGDIDLSAYTFNYINGYYRNGICVWTIEVEENEIIQLLITQLNIQTETRCNESARSYLAIYDGTQTDSSLLVRTCSPDELFPVTSTTRRLVVVLTLDEKVGFTQAWFTAHYKSFNKSAILRDCGGDISGDEGVVSSPNYPANYDNLRVCEWRITVEDPFKVKIEIHDIDVGPLSYMYYCAGDTLLFTGAYPRYTGQSFRMCGWHNNNYQELPRIYSVNNSLTIRFVSDWENSGRGFNLSWRKACQWPLQAEEGWIQSPGFPASYPDNVNCLYDINTFYLLVGTFITFTFNSFDLQEPDSKGSCIYDYLEILQVPWNNPGYFTSPEAKKVCGKGPIQNLTTYFPTTLHFVTDGSITKGGFNISFVETTTGCGESLLVGEKGFVTSPNYPGTFPYSIYCVTTIRVEPGHNITLTFQSFYLDDYLPDMKESNCSSLRYGGILEIYDLFSSGSVLIGGYCGYITPRPITSTSNELTLVFRSGSNYYATGFNATYVSTLTLNGKY